ncbi:protein immune deficiency-like [Glossina fuscipes]|uniref:Protein immune deficiency-like n=2 Tax=Nemorhina TaxID=44051 RepID=A0A9C5ZBC8_9MUSC|nr:protein immune deficiency-like [Glossina fuscipes]
MSIFKKILSNTLKNKISKSEGTIEKDAAPVEEINRKDDEQCLDNNNATDSTTDLTHSDTRLLEIQNNLESRINNMNVQNSQQHVVMQFSNVNKLHIGSVYNVHNENNANNKRKNVPADHIYDRNRKTTTIVAMMQSQEEPSHRIIDTIATHLGEGWKMVMRELGFSDGQISQAIIDHHIHGNIKEVIYQLLLDWVRNADDENRTVAYITKLLWGLGHRDCVHRMKQAWKANTKY